jgi:hypothetical protein
MSLVFESMASDAATPENFAQNPVTFVTFNYDRYLEYRFIRALTARYAIDDRAAWEALKGMGFVHVHGSLGDLPAQRTSKDNRPDTVVPLGAPETDGVYTLGLALPLAERSIRIVHDADPVGPGYQAARAALLVAAQVIFLGFGFGKQNVARLQTATIQPTTPVYCTAYGMTCAEIAYSVNAAFPLHGRLEVRKLRPLRFASFCVSGSRFFTHRPSNVSLTSRQNRARLSKSEDRPHYLRVRVLTRIKKLDDRLGQFSLDPQPLAIDARARARTPRTPGRESDPQRFVRTGAQ